MSIQPPGDLLTTLRETLRNLERDPAPLTDDRIELHRILVSRIDELEAAQRLLRRPPRVVRPTTASDRERLL